jgi:hypothetical protein
MASPAKGAFVVIPVVCFFCETKQTVHVTFSTGAKQVGDQFVQCVKCSESFSVLVPNTIIAGPFKA